MTLVIFFQVKHSFQGEDDFDGGDYEEDDAEDDFNSDIYDDDAVNDQNM